LQTREVGFKCRWTPHGQPVDDPSPVSHSLRHPASAQIAQMARHLGLCRTEDFLDVTHAQRTLEQEMDNAQSRAVAQALVYVDKIHVNNTYG